jgi:hypothetical protein
MTWERRWSAARDCTGPSTPPFFSLALDSRYDIVDTEFDGDRKTPAKNKEGEKMKRILAIVFMMTFLLVPLTTQAQSELAEKYGYDIFEYSMIEELKEAHAVFVTSSSLGVSDVVAFTKGIGEARSALKNEIEFVGIYGIHQEGNSATVFYRIKKAMKDTATPSVFETSTIDFVRFTSGVWFCPEGNHYLVKKK